MSRTCRFRSRLFPARRSRATTSSTSKDLAKITPNFQRREGRADLLRPAQRPRHRRGQQHHGRAQRRRLPRRRLCAARRRGHQLHARHGKRRSAARPAGHLVRPQRQRRRGLVPHRAAEVRRLFGRGDRRDRQRRSLQGVGLCQRAGRRQCGLPLRRLAAVVQGLLAQRFRRQAGRRDRRHHPARQLPRRNRADRMDFPRRLRQAQRRRRDQHRLRPRQRLGRAVGILQRRSSALRTPTSTTGR